MHKDTDAAQLQSLDTDLSTYVQANDQAIQ